MRQVIAGLVVLLVLLAAPAEAAHWERFFAKICLEDLLEIPQEIPEIPVPVGCEVVDCCPGCPGPPDFLEWRILVEKNARSVQIRLEGMDERALAGDGFAHVTREGNVLTVGPGESFVTGLPNARKGSVGVGMVRSHSEHRADPAAQRSGCGRRRERHHAGLQCRSRDSAARRKVHRQSLPLGAAHPPASPAVARGPGPAHEQHVE